MRVTLTGVSFLLVCGVAAAADTWTTGVAVFTQGPAGNDLALGFPKELPNAACGYGPITEKGFPGYKLVGISAKSSLKARPMGGCGTCLEVKCVEPTYCDNVNTTETVMVYDECKECTADQLNLNAKVFAELAPLDLGRMAIKYREVPCAFSGNIVVRVDSFRTAEGGWIRLNLRNVAGTADITSVQLAKAGTTAFIPMKNAYGANWELSKLPTPPYDLKVTTKAGATTIIKNAIPKAGVVGDLPTTAQLKA